MIIDKDKFPTEVDHKREEMSKKRHISFWLTEEDMNGYQHQILMPVIFCKDCRYWKDGYCDDSLIEGLEIKVSRFEDDFCSRGERKDE